MGSFDYRQYRSAITRRVVSCCDSQKGSIEPLLQLLQQVSSDAEIQLEQHCSDRSLIDCGPGCSSCCVVNVSTLLPEGLAIARYLRQCRAEAADEASLRLDNLWREVRGLDDDDRMFMKRNCAFLNNAGHCTIYQLRPLLCRSVTSASAQDCRDALSGKVFGEEKAILMHQFQQSLYELLFAGLADGLERSGLDGRSFQLAGLIRYLLKKPQAEQEWLSGRRLTWQDVY